MLTLGSGTDEHELVSVSRRVSTELGGHSNTVAYQIRFEGTASEKTRLKFVTDGVLLREIGNDISLTKYSAVIIDEAHERSLNTDILIGMLSRTVQLREEMASEDPKISPLKLISEWIHIYIPALILFLQSCIHRYPLGLARKSNC